MPGFGLEISYPNKAFAHRHIYILHIYDKKSKANIYANNSLADFNTLLLPLLYSRREREILSLQFLLIKPALIAKRSKDSLLKEKEIISLFFVTVE